ncbi:hypothetical protein [Streptomyces sp. NPDC012510]|uniref:hypothetical protein n=1 Tax=Streptomyces sp. NPDC012510 TaxID=3364838 RepID=UPI0036E82A6A
MIEPAGIPQFTGDFAQLEKDISGLRLEAAGISDAGGDVHSRFQALGAYYFAPEADDLFATTEPVMSGASAFAGKLETVADALEAYCAEARPLAKRLAQLQTDAYTFVDSVDGDDEWTYDEDKVQRHQALLDGVAAAESAFRAAERRAATKISALVGGPKFVADDGSHTVDKNTVMYGYGLDMLKGAGELPWGSPVQESHHAWELDHWGKTLVWDGIYKDNIEPAVTGLVDLATFDGEAWGGVRDVLTGIGLYTISPYDAFMDWAIGPDEESADEVRGKQAAKEFAKGLVAWDTWGENPVRASGTVIFNAFTLGAGSFTRLARGAEAGSSVAKGAGAAAKIGEYLDPLSAAVKVGGKAVDTIPRLSDVTARITSGLGTTTDSTRTTSVLELSDGSKVLIENGEFIHVDKNGNVVSAEAPKEPPVVSRHDAAEQEPVRQREPVGVGSAARPHEATAHVGDSSSSGGHTARDISDADGLHPGPGGTTVDSQSGSADHHSSGAGEGAFADQGGNGPGSSAEASRGELPSERANEPLPELTQQERDAHWGHLEEVESRSPEEFDELQRDPDKNGGISEPSKDEARVGLDLREIGRLPHDIQRPAQADHGEFYSPSEDKYYDIKGVHSDWPPFNNVRDKSQPFKGAYDPANNDRWVKKLAVQIVDKNRIVILDVRNANQAAIDDIKGVVEKNGWEDDVIWYP